MTQDAFFDAGSALMYAVFHSFTSRGGSGYSEIGSSILTHKIKALGRLRQELGRGGSADDVVLMAILWLALLEGRYGSKVQRDLHRRALGNLIAERGGLSHIDDFVRSNILNFEFFWALEAGETVIEDLDTALPRYYEGTEPEAMESGIAATLPVGFRNLKLSAKIVRTIQRTDELQRLYSSGANQQQTSNLNQWTYGSLFEVCASIFEEAQGEPSINALVCVGLLLYSSVAWSELEVADSVFLWTSVQWMRGDLTGKILRCTRRRSLAEERCLGWLTNLTVASWRSSHGTVEADGLNLTQYAARRFPAATNAVAKKELEQGFFWSKKFDFSPSAEISTRCQHKLSTQPLIEA